MLVMPDLDRSIPTGLVNEELSGEPTGYWPCGILAPVYEEANDRQARGNQERFPTG